MEFIRATKKDIELVYELVTESIRTSYHECYSDDIVEFFLKIHSKENIRKDIAKCGQFILYDNGIAVGTGCYKENHITRVYIPKKYQGKGYGTYIMDFLERDLSMKYDTIYLDPSLIAIPFYEKRGYVVIKHGEFDVGGNNILPHDIMEKKLKK